MNEITTSQPKKWYEKPENVLVYGVLGGVAVYSIKHIESIVASIVHIIEMGVWGLALLLVGSVLGFMLVNGDFHRAAWLLYENAMRKVTGLIVELDPIGSMKSFLKSLGKYQQQLKTSLQAMRGQAEKLTDKLSRSDQAQEHSLKLMSQAQSRSTEKGMALEMRKQGRKASRAEDLSITYQGLLNKVRMMIAVMEKVEEATDFMVVDIAETIETESEKRETINEAWKAMNAAKRILAKNKQREIYDMALEATQRDYAFKVGEIKQFMRDTESFINTMDLENGVADADALKMLERWEQRSLALLEGGSGKTKYRVAPVTAGSSRMLVSSTGAQVIDAEIVEGDRPSFATLFDKLDK